MSETKKRRIECEIDEQSIITELPMGAEAGCRFVVNTALNKLILFARPSCDWLHAYSEPQTFHNAWDGGLCNVVDNIEDEMSCGEWKIDGVALEKLKSEPLKEMYEFCYLLKDANSTSAAEFCQSQWLKFCIPITVALSESSEESENEETTGESKDELPEDGK